MRTLVEARDVTKIFGGRHGHRAVDSVSFSIRAGEVVGIVGESGSGKSTLARMICGLLPFDEGALEVDGKKVSEIPHATLWQQIQMVPQDSFGSLNPAMSLRDIVAEPIHFYRREPWQRARDMADTALEHVGIDPQVGRRRPTQISGGQRQRVALARALAAEPELLVCDESTSALDVSVQAQILVLLRRLRRERPFALVFVSHDISVVRYLADRVLVMLNGQIVEELAASDLTIDGASHGYTRRLLSAVPTLAG